MGLEAGLEADVGLAGEEVACGCSRGWRHKAGAAAADAPSDDTATGELHPRLGRYGISLSQAT